MSWAEIKKAINSDLSKPLNVKISELKDFLSGELFPVTRTTGKVIEVFNHPSDISIYNNRSNAEVCLAKFIAPKSGIYRYDADIIGNDNISAIHIISKLRSNSGIYYSGSAVTHYGLVPNYSKTAIGGYVYWGDTTSHPNSYTVEQVFSIRNRYIMLGFQPVKL